MPIHKACLIVLFMPVLTLCQGRRILFTIRLVRTTGHSYKCVVATITSVLFLDIVHFY